MRATQLTTKINGLTFTRWHYTGRPSARDLRNGNSSTTQANINSPWLLELPTKELSSDTEMKETGDRAGFAIEVYPTQQAIRTEGAAAFNAEDAAKIAAGLQAAAQLLKEFNDSTRCPHHGTTPDGDGPAFDCEGCFLETLSPSELQEHLTECGTEMPQLALTLQTQTR